MSPGGELCLDETFTREGVNDVSTRSAPPNKALERTRDYVAVFRADLIRYRAWHNLVHRLGVPLN